MYRNDEYRQWQQQAVSLALEHGLTGAALDYFQELFVQTMTSRSAGELPELAHVNTHELAGQLADLARQQSLEPFNGSLSQTAGHLFSQKETLSKIQQQLTDKQSRKTALRKILLTSAGTLAGQLLQSRKISLTESFGEMFNSSAHPQGLTDFFAGTIGQVANSFLSRERTRTTSTETDRSREAQALWHLSRSQQQAILTQNAQRGMRNL